MSRSRRVAGITRLSPVRNEASLADASTPVNRLCQATRGHLARGRLRRGRDLNCWPGYHGTVRTRLRHGPVPGISAVGAGDPPRTHEPGSRRPRQTTMAGRSGSSSDASPDPTSSSATGCLDPRVRQSGDRAARTGHISRRGQGHARGLLIEAAHAAVRTPGPWMPSTNASVSPQQADRPRRGRPQARSTGLAPPARRHRLPLGLGHPHRGQASSGRA
jgi:hypothetical protein